MRSSLHRRDRLGGAVAAIVVQALLGWGLIASLGVHSRRAPASALAVFQVTPPVRRPPPDPPARRRPRQRIREPAGTPARATPVVAPSPIVPLPVSPTVVAAAIPSTGAASSGAASSGNGSGGRGMGGTTVRTGGPPRQIRGEIRDSDYPKAAARENRSGGVDIRYLVGTAGRIERCEIVRSSGSGDLDETACRLARTRFRFEPAVDANGQHVPAWMDDGVEWVNHKPPSDP